MNRLVLFSFLIDGFIFSFFLSIIYRIIILCIELMCYNCMFVIAQLYKMTPWGDKHTVAKHMLWNQCVLHMYLLRSPRI